jgi:hypothetical protein
MMGSRIIRIAALYCNAALCTALHSQAFRLGEVTVNRVGIRLLMLLVLPKKVVRLPRDWAEASHLVWFVRSRNGGLF